MTITRGGMKERAALLDSAAEKARKGRNSQIDKGRTGAVNCTQRVMSLESSMT
jgi:hypothetical protein